VRLYELSRPGSQGGPPPAQLRERARARGARFGAAGAAGAVVRARGARAGGAAGARQRGGAVGRDRGRGRRADAHPARAAGPAAPAPPSPRRCARPRPPAAGWRRSVLKFSLLDPLKQPCRAGLPELPGGKGGLLSGAACPPLGTEPWRAQRPHTCRGRTPCCCIALPPAWSDVQRWAAGVCAARERGQPPQPRADLLRLPVAVGEVWCARGAPGGRRLPVRRRSWRAAVPLSGSGSRRCQRPARDVREPANCPIHQRARIGTPVRVALREREPRARSQGQAPLCPPQPALRQG